MIPPLLLTNIKSRESLHIIIYILNFNQYYLCYVMWCDTIWCLPTSLPSRLNNKSTDKKRMIKTQNIHDKTLRKRAHSPNNKATECKNSQKSWFWQTIDNQTLPATNDFSGRRKESKIHASGKKTATKSVLLCSK